MWLLAAPLLFVEVGETLVNFVDTALVGHVGATELAAIGLVGSVIEVAIVPAVGLVEAMQITVARRVGEGRDETVGTTFGRSLALVLAISVVLALALRLGAAPIGDRLIGSTEVARAVEQFFRFGAFGIVFLSLNLAYVSLWVALGRARVLVRSTAVVVLVNLVVSGALVLGPFGLPALGIEGAGIAFLAAEVAGFLVLGVHTARRAPFAVSTAARAGLAAPVAARGLARLGTPIALQALVEALRWVVFFLIVARLGRDALALSSALYAAYRVLVIPSRAFAETGYTMTSRSLGRGAPGGLAPVLRAISWRAYAVTLPLLAVALLFPEATLAVFTGDPGGLAGAHGAVQLVALGMVLVVAAELAMGAVFGTGDTAAGFAIELLLSGAFVGFAVLAALGLGLGLGPVWLALPAASGVGLAASVLWLRSARWRRAVV